MQKIYEKNGCAPNKKMSSFAIRAYQTLFIMKFLSASSIVLPRVKDDAGFVSSVNYMRKRRETGWSSRSAKRKRLFEAVVLSYKNAFSFPQFTSICTKKTRGRYTWLTLTAAWKQSTRSIRSSPADIRTREKAPNEKNHPFVIDESIAIAIICK